MILLDHLKLKFNLDLLFLPEIGQQAEESTDIFN